MYCCFFTRNITNVRKISINNKLCSPSNYLLLLKEYGERVKGVEKSVSFRKHYFIRKYLDDLKKSKLSNISLYFFYLSQTRYSPSNFFVTSTYSPSGLSYCVIGGVFFGPTIVNGSKDRSSWNFIHFISPAIIPSPSDTISWINEISALRTLETTFFFLFSIIFLTSRNRTLRFYFE